MDGMKLGSLFTKLSSVWASGNSGRCGMCTGGRSTAEGTGQSLWSLTWIEAANPLSLTLALLSFSWRPS